MTDGGATPSRPIGDCIAGMRVQASKIGQAIADVVLR